MTKQIRNNLAYVIALGAVILTTSTVVMAQSYSWIPLGSIASSWSTNGSHIYNSNAGSVVIGGLIPNPGLLLDVAGTTGASEYCDELGTSATCFQAVDVQWDRSGTNQYNSNSGNVGIGTSAPSQKLDVDGNVIADAYFYSSDQRLKDNVVQAPGIDLLSQLQGVEFTWINDNTPSMGLIAQEVEQVAPELVFTDPNTGFKSVDYGGLIAPLVQTVNEQQQQIEELHDLLKQLRSQQ